jgi:hypothetical protein
MIWIRGDLDGVVRPFLHSRGVGPAALVSTQSGTVAIPHPDATLSDAVRIAVAGRRCSGAALVFSWDDAATIAYVFERQYPRSWYWGSNAAVNAFTERAQRWSWFTVAIVRIIGLFTRNFRAKPKRFAGTSNAAAAVLGTFDYATVAGLFGDYERNSRNRPAEVFRAGARMDLAELAADIDDGAATESAGNLPVMRRITTGLVAIPVYVVCGAGFGYLVGLAKLPSLLAIFLIAAYLWVIFYALTFFQRRQVAGRPIDEVLPVLRYDD